MQPVPGILPQPSPDVSVVIPTYNCDRYIIQAVESVLGQTYTNYEIIVVDDGSTDNTRTLLQPYGDRLHYVYQNNQGVSAARNRGIQLAQGQWVAFLDADDWFLPNKLASQVACFKTQPFWGIVNSGYYQVNEQGDILSETEPWHYHPHLTLDAWLVGMPIIPSTMMFRRDWLERCGGFNPQLHYSEDADLIVRLMLMGCEAGWLREKVICYRRHGHSATSNSLTLAKASMAAREQLFKRADLPEQVRHLECKSLYDHIRWLAWRLYQTGHMKEMAEYLQLAFHYTRFSPTEAIADWITHLTIFSKTDGQNLDVIALTGLPVWQQLTHTILTQQRPKVSVIIATYNRSNYIKQTIESVLKQRDITYEIIVVDDGSTDNTYDILQPYFNQIRYFYHENQGVSASRNRGICLAQGEYIAFLDADDFFLTENKLAKQVACFDPQPALGMVHSGWRMVDHQNTPIRDVELWQFFPKLDLETWVLHRIVCPSAMMFRRDWLESVNGFEYGLHGSEDTDLMLRLAAKGCQSTWLQEITVCYRHHNASASTADAPRQANYTQGVLDKFFALPYISDHIRQLEREARYNSLLWHSWRMCQNGYWTEMTEDLKKSLNYSSKSVTETIAHWLESFTHWARDYGTELDGYSLSTSDAWQTLIHTVLEDALECAAPKSHCLTVGSD